MPQTHSLETALAEDAKEIQAKHESPESIEKQRIASINAALDALKLSFDTHPEFIIPDREAAGVYAKTFGTYLYAQLIKKHLNWPITIYIDTKNSQVSHKSKGTKSILVGQEPTLIYQVWVELKNHQIYVYWHGVTKLRSNP